MRSLILLLAVGAASCRAAPPIAAEPPEPGHPPRIAVRAFEPLRPPAAATSTATAPRCDSDALIRHESLIDSDDPGVRLFVMRVPAWTGAPQRGAVLFTHGAGSASSALWDLRTGERSFMRRLACAGFDTYAVDVRGFGGSTRPPALEAPAEGAPPAVRAAEVMPDVSAAVRFASETSSVAQVDLVGWSWGAEVAAMFAGQRPQHIRRLVLFAPIYDRRWPARHVQEGAWRPLEKREMYAFFDPAREDRAVLDEHVDALFRFTEGDALRLPNGPYRDIYGEDAPQWDASRITADTLVVRGEEDRASLEEHAYRLFTRLERAPVRRYAVIGRGNHFLFRTRDFRQLHAVVESFLLEVFE